jgi:hypothetical protein
VEEALCDFLAMPRFVSIDLGRKPVPDETTVCRFRDLLEEHDLGRLLFRRGAAIDRRTCRPPAAAGKKIPRMNIVFSRHNSGGYDRRPPRITALASVRAER